MEWDVITSKNTGNIIRKGRLTIHEPPAVRGYISFSDNEIKVREDLHNLQKYSWFVDTVDLGVAMKMFNWSY